MLKTLAELQQGERGHSLLKVKDFVCGRIPRVGRLSRVSVCPVPFEDHQSLVDQDYFSQ